jgi:hypothetical protein
MFKTKAKQPQHTLTVIKPKELTEEQRAILDKLTQIFTEVFEDELKVKNQTKVKREGTYFPALYLGVGTIVSKRARNLLDYINLQTE